MFSTTGKTITSATNYFFRLLLKLIFPKLCLHSSPCLYHFVLHYHSPDFTALSKTKQKQTQTNKKSLNILKDGVREGEKKKKRKYAGPALRLKLNWFCEFSNYFCATNADKREVLLSKSHFSHSTLKESDQNDFQ